MKNYYEILEVDKNASKEIIDKAYKTLVKKYHPDLKNDFEKLEAESKIKEINEAYDVLSDKLKREDYNQNFKNNYISIEEYNLLIEENNKLKIELNNLKKNSFHSTYNYSNTNQINSHNFNEEKFKKNENENISKVYNDNSIFKFLQSIKKNILKIFFEYFFIFIILLILYIFLKTNFFYNISDVLNLKDLLIISALILLFYTYKNK